MSARSAPRRRDRRGRPSEDPSGVRVIRTFTPDLSRQVAALLAVLTARVDPDQEMTAAPPMQPDVREEPC